MHNISTAFSNTEHFLQTAFRNFVYGFIIVANFAFVKKNFTNNFYYFPNIEDCSRI